MKIGQLAEFAGTTTRTVRHYHRLGLLPEPPRQSNGYRDYTVGDAIRLMRIRRLAASGVPLGSVAAILAEQKSDSDERDVVADLRSLIQGIEDEQATLARRKAALTAMLADAERGTPISALPADLAAALSDAIEAAPSPAIGAALRYERDLIEGLLMSGSAPEGMLAAYEATLSDEDWGTRYLALLGRWSDLEGHSLGSVAEEIASLVDALLEMFGSENIVLHSPEVQAGNEGSISLDDVISDPAQREVVQRIQRGLLGRHSTDGDIR
jgi:DNA-binding transcriptional MerR regulator